MRYCTKCGDDLTISDQRREWAQKNVERLAAIRKEFSDHNFNPLSANQRKTALWWSFTFTAFTGLIWGLINNLGPDTSWVQVPVNVVGFLVCVGICVAASDGYKNLGGKPFTGWAINVASLFFGVVVVRSILAAFF